MYWLIIILALIAIFVLIVLRNKKKKALRIRKIEARQEPTFNEDINEVKEVKKEIDEPLLNDPYELTSAAESKKQTPDASVASEPANDLIVMRIMADKDKEFTGYELLQTLLALGLRFGDMNIFHRHVKPNGEGPILFSLVSATEPGTFDIQNMGAFSSPGLTLFMQLGNQPNPNSALDIMLDTAQQLITELGGELWDDQHRHLDEVSIKRWRERVSHFERGKNNYDLFTATQ